jgi:hypothetical protein
MGRDSATLPYYNVVPRAAMSPEARAMLDARVESHRERVKRELLIESNRRPQRHVRCVETLETYDNAREAARAAGVLPNRIYWSIKYKRPTKGFCWEWA